MAQYIELDPGVGGEKVASDEISGVQHPKTKVEYGLDGSAVSVSDTTPFPIKIIGEASGESAKVTNGGLDVNVQDQHTLPVHGIFAKLTAAPTTLSIDAVAGAYTLTVTATTGFVAGTHFQVVEAAGTAFHATQIGAIAGNTITIDTPVEKSFAAGTTIFPININMNVDGSSAVQKFQFGPVGSVFEVDLTRMMGYLQDGTVMDDSLFGGVAALTRGCVFRKNNGDGTFYTYGNAKTNGGIAMANFDFAYTPKAPAGSYGARWSGTFAGQDKRGVTIRLGLGESLEWLIQDDLTGLEQFNLMAQGHIVE